MTRLEEIRERNNSVIIEYRGGRDLNAKLFLRADIHYLIARIEKLEKALKFYGGISGFIHPKTHTLYPFISIYKNIEGFFIEIQIEWTVADLESCYSKEISHKPFGTQAREALQEEDHDKT